MVSKSKIRRTYSLAVAVVVSLLILNQIVSQFFLFKQSAKGHLINIAGRQRMLSQKLSKYALLINKNDSSKEVYLENFKTAFNLFTQSHENLANDRNDLKLNHQNSDSTKLLFRKVLPFYKTIKIEGAKIFKAKQSFDLQSFIEAEENFLPIMNEIVFQYDTETDKRIQLISILSYTLFGVTLLAISFEIIFLIIPLEKEVLYGYEKLSAREEMMKLFNNRMRLLNNTLKKQNDEISAAQEELIAQKEEINALLNTMEEKVRTRTALLSYQNEKFKEYAFMNSHDVRAPLARIIGLIQLINMEKEKNIKHTDDDYINMIASNSQELDSIIREMNRLLEDVQFFQESSLSETPTKNS